MKRPTRTILHTSDLHLGMSGVDSYGCLQDLEAIANKHSVNLILIAGDLFDNPRIGDELARPVAERLQDIGCPIAIIAGNHDCLTPGSVLDRTALWSACDRIRIFRAPEGERFDWPDLGISIWGKSIDSEKENIRPLEGIPQPGRNGHWNIAAGHGFFVDRQPPLFPSYHITAEEIAGLAWDYIALGHIPVFRQVSENPIAYYSGSPTYDNTSALVELSEDKGVVVTCCKV